MFIKRKQSTSSEKEYSWQQILKDLSGDNGVDSAADAAEMLDKAADESHISDLQKLALSSDLFVSEIAAIKLVELQGVKELPLLLKALDNGMQLGHDCDGLVSAISSELEMNTSEAAPIVVDLLKSDNANERANAAWAYGFIEDAVQIEPLLELASDEYSTVRAEVASALSSFDTDPRAVDTLIQLLNDADEQVRISAIASLGYLGDKKTIPVLEKITKEDTSENVQRFIKDALNRLKYHQK
ncbi:MAG: HEAT repeat domain-containing protein [Chloroflexota bacterium]